MRRGFGISGIPSLKCASSLPSGSPISRYDELLLSGISPYQLDHSPYDLFLCDRGPIFHRDFGVFDDTMFVSTKLAIPRNPMAYGR
jgi:hypothetical protein